MSTIKNIVACTDIFDYAEYVSIEAEPMQKLEWSQKLGMLLVAKKEYTDLTDEDAYMKFITDNSVFVSAKNSPCCGGGQVK